MTDNTPALPATEAGRRLLAESGPQEIGESKSKWYCLSVDELPRRILAIEAEAAQARDDAWRASLTAWTVPAEAAQARDGELLAALRGYHAAEHCDACKAARALIESDRG